MEIINKYRAIDGSEWSTKEQALSREEMVRSINKVMSGLKTIPDDLNWDGYIQQNKDVIMKCKKDLFEIANQEGVLKWLFDSQKKRHGKTEKDLISCHPSWILRMLDGSHTPLSCAYNRLQCIDDKSREWNQPYFALNPNEGKNICIK